LCRCLPTDSLECRWLFYTVSLTARTSGTTTTFQSWSRYYDWVRKYYNYIREYRHTCLLKLTPLDATNVGTVARTRYIFRLNRTFNFKWTSDLTENYFPLEVQAVRVVHANNFSVL